MTAGRYLTVTFLTAILMSVEIFESLLSMPLSAFPGSPGRSAVSSAG